MDEADHRATARPDGEDCARRGSEGDPTRVYALANALRAESGFYRSDDAGASWERVGKMQPGAGRRGGEPDQAPDSDEEEEQDPPPQGANDNWYRGGDAGYYHELIVDPIRPDTIWSVDTNLERSTDGGKMWSAVAEPQWRACGLS